MDIFEEAGKHRDDGIEKNRKEITGVLKAVSSKMKIQK